MGVTQTVHSSQGENLLSWVQPLKLPPVVGSLSCKCLTIAPRFADRAPASVNLWKHSSPRLALRGAHKRSPAGPPRWATPPHTTLSSLPLLYFTPPGQSVGCSCTSHSSLVTGHLYLNYCGGRCPCLAPPPPSGGCGSGGCGPSTFTSAW
jgi:hypothetical protein